MQVGLNLVQQQTLKLAPQLVMQMKILLLSRMELETKIQEELEINPCLDVEPDDDSSDQGTGLLSYSEYGTTSESDIESKKVIESEPEVFERLDQEGNRDAYQETDIDWGTYFEDDTVDKLD
ncbi:MAG: hypothetical protein ABIJ40_10685, partial [Bacteroidota bacterium]